MSADLPSSPPRSLAHSPASAANHLFLVLRGLAGAIVGGFIGYFLFRWLASQGFYGILIPGAFIGFGAGFSARGRSLLLGLLCAAIALAVTIYAEWSAFPFAKDESLSFFLAHIHELRTIKLILIGVGVLCAFWFGQGR